MSDPYLNGLNPDSQNESSTNLPEDELDPNRLYEAGMAHYRARRWDAARQSFEQVKALQPNRRGIDAVLRELDIFLQLESVEAANNAGGAERDASIMGSTIGSGAAGSPTPSGQRGDGGHWWLVLVAVGLACVIVLVVYLGLQGVLPIPFLSTNQSVEALRNQCQSKLAVNDFMPQTLIDERACEALAPCSELARVVPNDPEALNGLEKAKLLLYTSGQKYLSKNDLASALGVLECIEQYAPDYRDTSEIIQDLRLRLNLDQQYAEAKGDLESQAYGPAIAKLLDIRTADSEYRPGTISDDLYEAYLGQGQRFLTLAADDVRESAATDPNAPRYTVTDEMLARLRDAAHDYERALEERPEGSQALAASKNAQSLYEGLERYFDWGWRESISALYPVYQEDENAFGGNLGPILCDAYQHQIRLLALNAGEDELLTTYRALQTIKGCDASGVREFLVALTPTATPTATFTPTATPTNTPLPTMTPIPTSVPTWTLTPTELPPPTSKPSNSNSKPKPTSKPADPSPPTRVPVEK